jgi:hypothetical protein
MLVAIDCRDLSVSALWRRMQIVTKVSERVRISALEAKPKQPRVLQQRKEARARTVEGRRTRREELRRKILVEAVVAAGDHER